MNDSLPIAITMIALIIIMIVNLANINFFLILKDIFKEIVSHMSAMLFLTSGTFRRLE